MPTPRDVLEKLPLADLKGLAEAAGVQVADKRKAATLADALVALGPAHLRVLLVDLSRDALKDACQGLGLDDSGREKALLVDRLIPQDPAASPAAPARSTVTSSSPGRTMARGKKQQKNGNGSALGFEAMLWIAADKLRNNFDAGEYKHVVRLGMESRARGRHPGMA